MMAVTVVLEPLEPADYRLQNSREKKENSLNTSSSTSSSEESQNKKLWHRRSWKKMLEIFLLTVVIVAVCSLFVTPTILYALPPLSLAQVPKVNQVSGSGMGVCNAWRNYTGELCFDELTKSQQCYGSQADVIRIPYETDQEASETTAKRLLQGLPLLSPSPECEAAIKPFLCLYLFGSCDADNQSHQATQADCLRLRDEVCTQEWALATRFLGQEVLPDCSTLAKQEDECQGLNSSMLSPDPTVQSNNISLNITCANGYYLSDSGVCRPLCSFWVEPTAVDSKHIAVAAIIVIGLMSSVVLIVLALTVQRRTMLMFPAYYLVYLCVTSVVLGLLLLTGLASKGNLFCSSYDLLETFVNETAYCTFAGIVFTYGIAQLGLFVLFHAVGLCWRVAFPFHFRRFQAEEKLKYVHITTLLIALLLPAVPALLHLKQGYGVAGTATTVCLGRSVVVSFFSFILPLSIISAVATSILVVMFWIFIKKSISLKFSVPVTTKRNESGLMIKAEAKILFIMCYYIIVGTIVLTLFTYLEAIGDVVYQTIEQHFTCQGAGLQPDKDCGVTPRDQLSTFSSLSVVSTIVSGLLPLVVMAFSVKCECKKVK